MDSSAEKLDGRLREWKPDTAAQARKCIAELIALADYDGLEIARPRIAEQEVLDVLDEPPTCSIWLANLVLAVKTRPVVIASCTTPRSVRASYHPAKGRPY